MADITKSIEFVLKAVDEASPDIKKLGSGIHDLGDSLGDITGPITAVSDKLLLMEGAIGAAAAALAAFSIKQAVGFQSATIDLQKVLSDTDGDIQQFAQAAIDLSNKYGVAAANVLQSTASFKQAGFSAADALKLTEESLKAVNITELDSAGASEAFVRILKGFNAPASEAAHVLDGLNEISNHYAASAGKLADAVARSAPIAKQTGFSFDELAGVLTPMIEVFQDSEKTSRAFNSTLQRLISDNPDVVQGLQALRVSQQDLNGQLRPGKDILHDIQEQWHTLPDTMKPVVAQLLAGSDEAAKMVIAFENLDKTTEITNAALDSAGSANKELATRMQATEVVINQATEAFKNAASLVGLKLLPRFTDQVRATGDLDLALQTVTKQGGFDPLIGLFNNLTDSLARTVEGIAKALPQAVSEVDFQPLIRAVTGLVEAVTGFNNLDLTKPEDLAKALQFLVNLSAGLTNFTTGFVEGMKPLVASLVSAAGAAGETNPKIQEFLGHVAGAAKSIELLTPAIEGLGTALKGVAVTLPIVGSAIVAVSNPAVGIPLLA